MKINKKIPEQQACEVWNTKRRFTLFVMIPILLVMTEEVTVWPRDLLCSLTELFYCLPSNSKDLTKSNTWRGFHENNFSNLQVFRLQNSFLCPAMSLGNWHSSTLSGKYAGLISIKSLKTKILSKNNPLLIYKNPRNWGRSERKIYWN